MVIIELFRGDMKAFREYANQLDALLDDVEWGNRVDGHLLPVEHSLNGEAAEALHRLGNPNTIWRNGAYFTSQRLADMAISPITRRRRLLRCPVYDPTCGAGDLLLRWADDLPVFPSLKKTIESWEPLLNGCELFPEFLRVAKRRLVLKAIARGASLGNSRSPKVDRLFRGLREGDARTSRQVEPVLTLVMNPPFSSVDSPNDCQWSSGKVSLAALLFESCLKRAAASIRIVAILPDVLRTGTRYTKWRDQISKRLIIQRIQPYGRFDDHADIDVFIIEGVVGSGTASSVGWWDTTMRSDNGTMGQVYNVSVGAVVPHRDPHKGQWSPFATAKSVSAWEVVRRIGLRRRFDGTKVQPPFVTVRRTSSPRDPERAIGSVVLGQVPVAVENHLIVLKPKRGGWESCEFALQNLKHARTKAWLDQRIRCRHLTVGVLRELPIWEASP